jgi:hypothetical protein
VLDIQPGRGDFLTEVRRYERFLREPDVGLALDAEWSMRAGQVPGETIARPMRPRSTACRYLDGW